MKVIITFILFCILGGLFACSSSVGKETVQNLHTEVEALKNYCNKKYISSDITKTADGLFEKGNAFFKDEKFDEAYESLDLALVQYELGISRFNFRTGLRRAEEVKKKYLSSKKELEQRKATLLKLKDKQKGSK